jgi:rhodanese-related sulfurtransferase
MDLHRREVDVATLAAAASEGAPVVDVREPYEYAAGHVPGAEMIPMSDLPRRFRDLPTDRRVYVICASGNRSLAATAALVRAGLDAVSVRGGTAAWERAGFPVVVGMRAA